MATKKKKKKKKVSSVGKVGVKAGVRKFIQLVEGGRITDTDIERLRINKRNKRKKRK